MRLIDADAFKEWLMENSINERERDESREIGLWLDAFPSAEPERKKSKLIVDDFNTEIWGANSNCSLCGCSWQINDHGVDNFCPNCGVSLREGEEE